MADNSIDTLQFLPNRKSFQALLWPYLTPYLVYILLSSIPDTLLAVEATQAIKLSLTGAVLLWFRSQYRLDTLKISDGVLALSALPVALLLWIGPFYLLSGLGITDISASKVVEDFSILYFYLRLVNSVVLVAIFEELFIRVYVMQWLFQAGPQRQEKGIYTSILDTLDQHPRILSALPLSAFSVIGATIVFAVGHQAHEYLSAVLYFLFTTWIYKKGGSIWVCILIHGFTNLVIGVLVRYGGMGWLWCGSSQLIADREGRWAMGYRRWGKDEGRGTRDEGKGMRDVGRRRNIFSSTYLKRSSGGFVGIPDFVITKIAQRISDSFDFQWKSNPSASLRTRAQRAR